LHVWGEPRVVAREAARYGTTAFLTTLGPSSAPSLRAAVAARVSTGSASGAACLGLHLEGPFVNPACAGALPRRAMRPPTVGELERLAQAARGCLRLLTLAPELRGATEAIRWCRRHRVAVSLGHSAADAATATRAVEAGAQAVTHIFNGMRPLHHRAPSLLDAALLDPRLTVMVIADGVHVSAEALRLLVRAKGPARVALVTDSIRHAGWDVVRRRGAFYRRDGTLAGSDLTMMRAVRNTVKLAGVSLAQAVQMAGAVPAGLLGLGRSRGTLEAGKRADLVAFDRNFRVLLTIVGGTIVHDRLH
jgi:N-acetylglucosamine-6-phosphate deacetylase